MFSRVEAIDMEDAWHGRTLVTCGMNGRDATAVRCVCVVPRGSDLRNFERIAAGYQAFLVCRHLSVIKIRQVFCMQPTARSVPLRACLRHRLYIEWSYDCAGGLRMDDK